MPYPYKTFARKETHPARIGALARLHGINSKLPSECALFEIGCGDGGNIIPLAAQYPNASFLGIDRSLELIEKGREECRALNLNNIELVCEDIVNYHAALSSFDYVICHGLYSWVSPNVQQEILERAKSALNSEGVLFVSYNTLPGWRQRGALRDIMQVGASFVAGEDDVARLDNAMAFLDLVVENSSAVTPYLKEAAQRLKSSEPSYLVQEFLGDYNSALSFTDFIEAASQAGFQYLTEARTVMTSIEDLADPLKEIFEGLGDDVLAKEQVIDIVRNRMFRETLLCHSGAKLDRGLSSTVFKELTFVALYIPDGDGVSATEPNQVRLIERLTGRSIDVPRGECAATLAVISKFGAHGVKFSEILRASGEGGEGVVDQQECLRAVFTLWKTGFIEALSAPICSVDGRAVVSPVARMQAVSGGRVTSALHESFNLSSEERAILAQAVLPLSFSALEVGVQGIGDSKRIRGVIESLRERGFFL